MWEKGHRDFANELPYHPSFVVIYVCVCVWKKDIYADEKTEKDRNKEERERERQLINASCLKKKKKKRRFPQY